MNILDESLPITSLIQIPGENVFKSYFPPGSGCENKASVQFETGQQRREDSMEGLIQFFEGILRLFLKGSA